MISNAGIDFSRTSSSTMRSSSLPSRSCWRNFSRVREPGSPARSGSLPRLNPICWSCAAGRGGTCAGIEGSSRSSRRSSAFNSALSVTSSSFSSRTMSMAISTRSRTIDSTSRPTYPTSVNFDASTFMKGEFASFARRRAISVLPTPVGPIMMMFLGMTSSASSAGSFWRRMRLRSAMATARFAWFCPTTYLSSSRTISRGVSSSSAYVFFICGCGKINGQLRYLVFGAQA